MAVAFMYFSMELREWAEPFIFYMTLSSVGRISLDFLCEMR